MKTEDIRKMAQAWQSVQEASKKKMDKVDQKELEKDFDDRDDKDIDNDGDADKSDKYLHNRRKAVSKAMKKGEEETINMGETKKESTQWSVYNRILENRAAHYKGATAPEGIMDKESKGSKDFAAKHTKVVDNTDEKGHNDMEKAGRATKKSPMRRGDNTSGDTSIINKPEDITKKGQGA